MPNEGIFRSNGKLLISGEYVVMDGAKALAIPTKKGQRLKVSIIEDSQNTIHWKALNLDESLWFETQFNYHTFEILKGESKEAQTLITIFSHPLVQEILKNQQNSWHVETHLDFPKEWGLGTSSTLINNISQWLDIDAYALQFDVFGGSGYDIACAQHSTPISYQRTNEQPKVEIVDLSENLKNNMYFVYLNQKQNTREAITHYQSKILQKDIVKNVSTITEEMIQCAELEPFQRLIHRHNRLISHILDMPSIEVEFEDFEGAVKNLGAWGGDFILAVSEDNPKAYFAQQGYETCLNYQEMFG